VGYARVSGSVTVDNKPVARAEVVLSCEEVTVKPRSSTPGVTDDKGHSVLRARRISAD
jgi:hypothetical protein